MAEVAVEAHLRKALDQVRGALDVLGHRRAMGLQPDRMAFGLGDLQQGLAERQAGPQRLAVRHRRRTLAGFSHFSAARGRVRSGPAISARASAEAERSSLVPPAICSARAISLGPVTEPFSASSVTATPRSLAIA